jgi:hypothetical protein
VAISYVSGSNTTYASRTNTTVTAPASIANNDVMLAWIITAGASEAVNPTAPAGWTEIGTAIDVTDLASFNLEARCYIKVASSESGNYTWTHTSSSSQGSITVYRGVDTTTPQDATSTANSGFATGVGNVSTATGLTTVTNGAWIVFLGFDWADSSNNLSPPTGMTERLDVVLSYAATEEWATAGATGNRSHVDNSNIASNSRWGARLVALRPAGGTAYNVVADAGSYSITGTAAGTLHGSVVSAAAGSYAITGTAAVLSRGLPVVAGAGSYAITGTAAEVLTGRMVAAAAGSYAITGTAAGILKGRTLAADAGSYAITGSDAGLVHASLVGASAGSYSITGTAAVTLHGSVVSAEAGSYAITGAAASLVYGQLGAYTITAEAGSYAITGMAASTLHGYAVAAVSGSYSIAGPAAGLISGKKVVAAAGSYALTGQPAALGIGGRNYYVRVGGSNGAAGSTGAPWATPAYGVSQLNPGDTLHIGDGTWGAFNVDVSGQPGAPITVRSENLHGAFVDVDEYAAIIVAGNYVVLDGLRIRNYGRHGVEAQYVHHITYRNMWVHDCGGNGLGALQGDFFLIEDNLCEDNGRTGWNSGISIYQPDHRATGDEVTPGIERNIIRRNITRRNRMLGFVNFDTGSVEVEVGDTVVVGANVVTGIADRVEVTSGSWGAGTAAGRIGLLIDADPGTPANNAAITVGGTPVALINGSSGVYTDHGQFTDGNGIILDDWGWFQDDPDTGYEYPFGALIEDNLTYLNGGKGIQCYCVQAETIVRNNTSWHNNRDGNQIPATYRGDITTQASIADVVKIVNNVSVCDRTFDSNIHAIGVYDGDAILASNITWNGVDSDDAVTAFNSTITDAGGNQFGVDPQFTDPAGGDFHLLAGSPAVDAGTDAYGFSTSDIEGEARSSSTINLGAFEALTTEAYSVSAAPGSYVLSGSAASILYGRAIGAEVGAYEISGTDVSLIHSASVGFSLEAGGGTYAITGSDAGLLYARLRRPASRTISPRQLSTATRPPNLSTARRTPS